MMRAFAAMNMWGSTDLITTRKPILDFIKEVGKQTDREKIVQDIDLVIQHMEDYAGVLTIQQACCHTLSNICMNIDLAEEFIESKHIHRKVIKAVRRFHETDWKICWYGASAMWNMTRSAASRNAFNIRTVEVLMRVLEAHQTRACVVNAAIGALSNLSLNHFFKEVVGESHRLNKLMKIIDNNIHDMTVSATSAGLLANLAVNDGLANLVVDVGAMTTLKTMFLFGFEDSTWKRNVLAALTNCVTSPEFLREFIRYRFNESLLVLKDSSNELDIVTLIVNLFSALDIDPEIKTSSYHLACKHGYPNILRILIDGVDEEIDFNSVDGNSRTLISYALESQHIELISYLSKCGAWIHTTDDKIESFSVDLLHAVVKAGEENENIEKEYANAISIHANFPSDISGTVIDFLSPYSLYKAKKMI